MTENRTSIPPFGLRDKLGYMLGNVANDLTFAFAGVFLLVFYTKVLGISPAAVGTVFMLARFADAVTDVTMGRICDRSPVTANGKFRPWLVRMCIPTAAASFLMYQSGVAGAPLPLKLTYAVVTYLLWGSIFYTSVNIPYGSMASVITPNASDRSSLSTARSVGSLISNLAVGVIAPFFIYRSAADGTENVIPSAFPRVAAVFSLLAVGGYLACYFLTRERVILPERPSDRHLPFKKTASSLVKDRALIGIVLASVCVLAAQLLSQSVNQYLFIDYFKDRSGIVLMSAVSMLPSLALAPAAAPLAARFGKKELGVFGSLVAAASSLLLLVLRTKSVWVYITVSLVGFLGFGVFNLIIWAFISDVIDDRQIRSGSRDDGTVYAVYSFARKVGQAIAGGLGGWTLAAIGFEEGLSEQTEAVANGIYTVSTLLPAVLYLAVALILAFIYPLGKKRVEENVKRLKGQIG